jgi:hypothetical protein
MGGILSDHTGPRQLLSIASAVQRQDGRGWGNDGEISGMLAAIPTGREFLCPVKIIQTDPRFGSAFSEGHEARLAKSNPQVEIVRYTDSGHRPHGTLALERRFLGDLQGFGLSLESG